MAKDRKKEKAEKDRATAGPSVAAHPRAGYHVRRAKGWGGLAGFTIAAVLSWQAGVPADELGLRALIAGVAGYIIFWACSVTVWRHLVVAELRARHEHLQAERARRDAQEDLIDPHGSPGANQPAPVPASGV